MCICSGQVAERSAQDRRTYGKRTVMQCGMSWPSLKIKPENSRLKSKSPFVKLWDADVAQILLASL